MASQFPFLRCHFDFRFEMMALSGDPDRWPMSKLELGDGTAMRSLDVKRADKDEDGSKGETGREK
jgi:hypothetical protein